MATKSVIEIEIIDEQFKAFDAQLKAMQKTIAKMPEQWKKITKEVDEEQKIEKKAASDAEKARKQKIKDEKDFNKILEERKKSLSDAATSAKSIAGSLASAAVSSAKWLAYGAIGGSFGLGGLAAAASETRRQAQGYGVTTGQLRSANVNLGRYIDPTSALGNIADIQNDLTRRQIIGRLGGATGQNPAEMLGTVMKSAVQQFKAGGQTQQYAEAMGLTQVFSLEELRRLASLSEKELKDTVQKYKEDQKLLALDDAASKAWQDFWVQIKRSGNLIENSFIKNLQTLTPALEKLSKTIADAIDNFLKSEKFQKAVEKFSKWLETDFIDDLEKGVKGIVALGEAAYKVAKFFGLISETKEEKNAKAKAEFNNLSPAQQRASVQMAGFGSGSQKLLHAHDAENRAKAYQFLVAKGVNPEAAKGFLGGIQQESGFATRNSSWDWKTGTHVGIAQWDESRQAAYKKAHGGNLIDASIEEQLNFMWEEFNNKEKKAGDALKSGLTKASGVTANLQYERPANENTAAWNKEFTKRLDFANTIKVEFSNMTGSSITANVVASPGATEN